jgi:hypothetical protein
VNKFCEVRDAGDCYVLSSRLYASVMVPKMELRLAKADLLEAILDAWEADFKRALKSARMQITGELAKLEALEAPAEVAEAA